MAQESETFVDLHFPRAGIDLSNAFWDQRPRQVGEGDYARSTPSGNNVQAFDGLGNRSRGGSRPGLVKYVAQPVVAGWIVQDLNVIVTTE